MSEPKKLSLPVLGDMDRRTAVKAGAATLGLAAWAAAVKPWFEWTSELNTDEFLQKHYRELTPEQLQTILNKLTAEARAETGRPVTVKDHKPIPGVSFAYALNLSICIGCRKCAEACHVENNHDRPSHQSYIRVFEMQKGGIDFEKGNATYDHPVPAKDKYYMPVQCQQCENPPCVKA
ncbi:MAG: 4Fe-4S ferredoxin, partial [Gemmataceae bacterium]